MWTRHMNKIIHLFKIGEGYFGCIKIPPQGENLIDGSILEQQMTTAIDAINEINVQEIRIVGMGVSGALGVFQALESLVRGWNLSWEHKKVQFVALGDSKDRVYLNFCKRLCLKKICATVHFYLTMDYNNFGYLDLDRIPITDVNQVEELLRVLRGQNVNN